MKKQVRGKVLFETVRELGLRLPGAEESTAYGKPALKVRGQMFACLASHRSAEPDSLVVRVDFEQRAELLAAQPDVYYITDHYKDYSGVLVRLQCVKSDLLRDLIGMAYRFVTSEAAREPKKKRPRSGIREAAPVRRTT
jgi:hypothetical protein